MELEGHLSWHYTEAVHDCPSSSNQVMEEVLVALHPCSFFKEDHSKEKEWGHEATAVSASSSGENPEVRHCYIALGAVALHYTAGPLNPFFQSKISPPGHSHRKEYPIFGCIKRLRDHQE